MKNECFVWNQYSLWTRQWIKFDNDSGELIRLISDERLERVPHETSRQSRRSEKVSIQNSSRSGKSSSSSSSTSSQEEGQEMEIELNPENVVSSQEIYEMYKETVGGDKYTTSKVGYIC